MMRKVKMSKSQEIKAIAMRAGALPASALDLLIFRLDFLIRAEVRP
jgi:hypothetical protein